MNSPHLDRMAVCSWSLKPSGPGELIEALRAVGLPRVQLALDPLVRDPATWGDVAGQFQAAGITIVSGMFGCVGENYSSLAMIRATGGVVPDQTWPETWAHIQRVLPVAAGLGLKLITFHAGFIHSDRTDLVYPRLLARLSQIAGLFDSAGIALALETGQEDAHSLNQFLGDLNHPRVGVNFDPGNMILYDKGDPVKAVATLAGSIRQVHIKDAKRTQVTGTWGKEMAVGEGEVDWPALLATLKRIGFRGPLVIEREAGPTRVADIIKATEKIVGEMEKLR